PIRERFHVPGMVGAVVHGDRVVAVGAAGVRRADLPDPITVDDQVHIGSCTKAMTATLLARLVEEKRLNWTSTVGDVFPEMAGAFDPDSRDITLEQLLTHRSGLLTDVAWDQ